MATKTNVVNHETSASSLQAVPAAPTPHLAESTAIIQVIERAALNPDVDIDKMERLLQMQERVMDRQAMMAYSAAMAAMQTELPSIEERGQTNNGCYATLEDIVDTVRPIMQKHGFAVSFRIQTQERGIQITGVLMHKDGHREETSMLLPADMSGNKKITTKASIKLVTPFQAGQIQRLISQCPATTQEWFSGKYGSAVQVPQSDFDKLRASLSKRSVK
jgi:hypothetical protein